MSKNLEAVQQALSGATKSEETQKQAVARLAALPPLDYDRVREKEAGALNVRVSTLDKEVSNARRPADTQQGPAQMFPTVEPWPEPVNGEALLTDIANTIRRFIVCDKETVTAAALWIVFTWFIDKVQVAPLAVITAPEKRCGKSQLLDLLGRLARDPLVASNISPAAIFRVIEAHGPTLLIDEADAFLKDNEEARGILNSGHTRQSAYVIRVVGDDHEPKQFSTWGAKAISGIGAVADTLMDRAVVLELRRKLPHENVERLRHADRAHFQRLTSKLSRYADDEGEAIGCARPALPEALNDRAQDNWEPLLAIADHAGGDWPKLARDAALKISRTEQDTVSLSAELLADIKEIFETKGVEKITSTELLHELNADEEKPWASYNRGNPMKHRQLAKRLSEYGIKSQTIRFGTGRYNSTTFKGFQKASFEDAFTRYLSQPSRETFFETVTPEHMPSVPAPEPYFGVPDSSQRYGSETLSETHKPLKTQECFGVTDKYGLSAVEERAAIMEFDGGMPRGEAEAAAKWEYSRKGE